MGIVRGGLQVNDLFSDEYGDFIGIHIGFGGGIERIVVGLRVVGPVGFGETVLRLNALAWL